MCDTVCSLVVAGPALAFVAIMGMLHAIFAIGVVLNWWNE